jgi:hypothetical protein
MEELRHSVIRTVRTSAIQVDRRGSARLGIDLACRVMIGGQAHRAQVVDLSGAGARVRGAPAFQAGIAGTLAIDGVGYPLPFIVTRSLDDTLGLAFALDKATEAKLRETLGRLGQQRAA